MKILLLSIPVLTTILGIFLYRFQDKKLEIFKLDFVQFMYLFIITPTYFVWTKSFLFYILRNELDYNLTITDLFVIDTIFSTFSFILMAAIAIHSLTKTFRLKRDFDPHFDLFHLSEYFHLWWTHIVMTTGAMVVATFISISNVLVPFTIEYLSKPQFYLLLLAAAVFGVLLFFILWMTDAQQGNFMRIMKILLGFFLLVHFLVYFIAEPVFNMTTGLYWFVFVTLLTSVLCGSWFEKYEKPNKIRNFLVNMTWGNNIDLFGHKKNK